MKENLLGKLGLDISWALGIEMSGPAEPLRGHMSRKSTHLRDGRGGRREICKMPFSSTDKGFSDHILM